MLSLADPNIHMHRVTTHTQQVAHAPNIFRRNLNSTE